MPNKRFDISDDDMTEPQQPVWQNSIPMIATHDIHPASRDGLAAFDFGEQVSPRLPKEQTFNSQNCAGLVEI
jgi:hypothetical protein